MSGPLTGVTERQEREKMIPIEPRKPTAWDSGRRAARPILIAAVIGTLVFIQVRAHYRQYLGGFRPFAHEPTRVPFSWDMFAVRISRCNVIFEPALTSADGKRKVRTMADLSPVLEWNPIFNEVNHYANWARNACGRYGREGGQKATFICFDPMAQRTRYDVQCP